MLKVQIPGAGCVGSHDINTQGERDCALLIRTLTLLNQGPTFLSEFNYNCFLRINYNSIFKYSPTGLRLQHMNIEGGHIQFITFNCEWLPRDLCWEF